jgi:predicted dehydrogenase
MHTLLTSGGNKYRSATTVKIGVAVPHFTTLGSALASVETDIVYIGTPPVSHRALAVEALRVGKHVLLEKPLAATSADADAIVAAADAAKLEGVVCGLNIGMRYNHAVREMRRCIATSTVGALVSGQLRMHYAQWPREWQTQPWCAGRAQGGPLREVGTHFLFGILEVFGRGSVQRGRAVVEYPDGDDGVAAESRVDGAVEVAVPGRSEPLVITITVRTDGSDIHPDGRDRYELELVGDATSSLLLYDFTSLRILMGGVADAEPLVRSADYGRKACVSALLREVTAKKDGVAHPDESKDRLVTARDARQVQLIVDALLTSHGDWVDIESV